LFFFFKVCAVLFFVEWWVVSSFFTAFTVLFLFFQATQLTHHKTRQQAWLLIHQCVFLALRSGFYEFQGLLQPSVFFRFGKLWRMNRSKSFGEFPANARTSFVLISLWFWRRLWLLYSFFETWLIAFLQLYFSVCLLLVFSLCSPDCYPDCDSYCEASECHECYENYVVCYCCFVFFVYFFFIHCFQLLLFFWRMIISFVNVH